MAGTLTLIGLPGFVGSFSPQAGIVYATNPFIAARPNLTFVAERPNHEFVAERRIDLFISARPNLPFVAERSNDVFIGDGDAND